MGDTIYDRDLDRVAANYQPLTPSSISTGRRGSSPTTWR